MIPVYLSNFPPNKSSSAKVQPFEDYDLPQLCQNLVASLRAGEWTKDPKALQFINFDHFLLLQLWGKHMYIYIIIYIYVYIYMYIYICIYERETSFFHTTSWPTFLASGVRIGIRNPNQKTSKKNWCENFHATQASTAVAKLMTSGVGPWRRISSNMASLGS